MLFFYVLYGQIINFLPPEISAENQCFRLLSLKIIGLTGFVDLHFYYFNISLCSKFEITSFFEHVTEL